MRAIALDIATATGWAIGDLVHLATDGPLLSRGSGPVPLAGTKHFPGDVSNAELFRRYYKWLETMHGAHDFEALLFEGPILIRKGKKTTGLPAARKLYGMIAVTQLFAANYRLMWVREGTASDVRGHFCAAGGRKKDDVMEVCRQAGWEFDSHDAADALALLSYGAMLLQKERRKAAA